MIRRVWGKIQLYRVRPNKRHNCALPSHLFCPLRHHFPYRWASEDDLAEHLVNICGHLKVARDQQERWRTPPPPVVAAVNRIGEVWREDLRPLQEQLLATNPRSNDPRGDLYARHEDACKSNLLARFDHMVGYAADWGDWAFRDQREVEALEHERDLVLRRLRRIRQRKRANDVAPAQPNQTPAPGDAQQHGRYESDDARNQDVRP